MHVTRNFLNAIRVSGAILAVGLALVAGVVAAAGTTTYYKYDALGRVIEVTYPDGSKITYAYDDAGNRTEVKRTAGA